MLAGQVITLGDSFIIALTGLLIVMLELAFLAVFIQVMSKLLAAIVKQKESTSKKQASLQNAFPSSEEADELAIIMTTVLEETEWSMDEVMFRSITRLQ